MDILYIVTVVVVILISMTLHEAMHGFTAYWLGDDTARLSGRLTLNPIKHIDPFMTLILPLILALSGMPIFGGAKPVPFNSYNLRFGEWGVALVAIAGPLTNFLLAFIAFACYVLLHLSPNSIGGSIVVTVIMVNLGFFAFNILPIPPLDGSRVLYALAPDFVRRGMELVEQFGVILIFSLILIMGSLLGQIMNGMITALWRFFCLIFGVQA